MTQTNMKTLEKIIFYSSPDPFPGVLKWEEVAAAAQQSDFKTLSEIKVECVIPYSEFIRKNICIFSTIQSRHVTKCCIVIKETEQTEQTNTRLSHTHYTLHTSEWANKMYFSR